MKTRSTIIRGLAFCLAVILAGLVDASDVGDLYSAEVPVGSEDSAERTTALRQALAAVMVRVSGSTAIAGRGDAQQILQQASSLVQQFRYRLDDGVDTEGAAVTRRYLWAKFDQGAVERLMRSANLPVWGQQRPRVLIWLAVDNGGSRRLINPEDSAWNAVSVLEQQAWVRGMPIQLPLMDLEDRTALGAADLWSGYRAGIDAASVRYPHDVILTGAMQSLGGGRWTVDWTLFQNGMSNSFSSRGVAWAEALRAGIDGAQDLLAEQYAPMRDADASSGGAVTVMFLDIDSLDDYGRLQRLLGGKNVISALAVREYSPQGMTVDIRVRGNRDTLQRALELGGELLPVDTDPVVVPPIVQPAPPLQGPGNGAPVAAEPVVPVIDLTYRLAR